MERGAGAGNARSAAADGTADSEGDSKEMQPPFAAWRRGEGGQVVVEGEGSYLVENIKQ